MACASLPIGASRFQNTIASADASTPIQVVPAVVGKSFYLIDVVISVEVALTMQLQDGNGSPAVLVEDLFMPASSVWSKTWAMGLKVAAGEDLDVLASGAGNISITVTGYYS